MLVAWLSGSRPLARAGPTPLPLPGQPADAVQLSSPGLLATRSHCNPI